jgi:hypothetical protein
VVVYSFFAAFLYVYSSVYGFDVQENGLTFLSIAAGSLIGSLHMILVDRLQWWKKQGNTEKCPPEYRLYDGMVGSFGLPLGLFWFAGLLGWNALDRISHRRRVHCLGKHVCICKTLYLPCQLPLTDCR